MVEKFEKIKIRTLTIFIGLPLVIFIIFRGGLLYNSTVVLLAILGTLELWYILKKQYQPSIVSVILASLFFLLRKTLQGTSFSDTSMLFTFVVLFIFLEHFIFHRKNMIANISITLFASIYIGHLLSFLIALRGLENGIVLIIFALFTTWMSDTAAYIFGTFLGSKHIFPTISPKKTLEGSIGGMLGGSFCGLLFCFYLPINPFLLFLLGLLASVFGQSGDLFESMIKRTFNIKDSGRIIPGHGGVLDCMDSILFSVPVLYFCFLMIAKYINF